MLNDNPMSLAKSRMLIKHVFFAALLLETKLIAWTDAECKAFEQSHGFQATACTDMRQIWYSPKFLAGLSKGLVLFVLAHEVMHIALKHGLRRMGRDGDLWNIACDFAINILLKDAGFEVWDKAYLDKFNDKPVDFKGMSAEQIYSELVKLGDGQGGKGKGTAGPKGDHQGGMSGDVIEPGDMTSEERGVLERRIAQRVVQAATAARMCGQMKGSLAQLVDGIINPPLTWQELLRDYMTKSVPQDENWSHRNRRHQNIYLPGKKSDAMGEMIIIGDTSGSLIGSDIFAQIGAEIAEIREQVKPDRVRVIWADDDECNLQEVFEMSDEVVLHPTGGGGTDMRKPLKFIEQYDPIVCVLATDCYTPWPDEATPFPLIVLSNTTMKAPEWAMTIRI